MSARTMPITQANNMTASSKGTSASLDGYGFRLFSKTIPRNAGHYRMPVRKLTKIRPFFWQFDSEMGKI